MNNHMYIVDKKINLGWGFVNPSLIWGKSQLHTVGDMHVTDQVDYNIMQAAKVRNDDLVTGSA
jgi:hypothetical protein